MPGKAPRQKGNRFEREIVEVLRSAGLDAYRIPLSGAQRGFKGDVVVRLQSRELRLEAKIRKHGFKFIYDSLGDNDCLCVRVDRDEPLVIMPLSTFTQVLSAKEGTNPPASTPSDNLYKPTSEASSRLWEALINSSKLAGEFVPVAGVGNGDAVKPVLGNHSSDVSRETTPIHPSTSKHLKP